MVFSVPVVTAVFAAILGLLAAGLTVNVIVNRVRLGVDAGDGGTPRLAQAIRAHGNFAEHVPLALLLIAATEMIGYRAWIVYVLGGVLVVARLLSAWGLNQSLTGSKPRSAGAGLTVLVTVAASALILYAAFGGR
jgi:uncharacterized membrane protein YecN with MAPEG domain